MNDVLALPPQAIEAEQSVLGAMLLDNRCIEDVIDVLRVDDFYRSDHQKIFSQIVKMDSESLSVDVVTVSEALSGSDVDLSYLGSIARNTPRNGNALAYSKVIIDRSKKRKVIEVCNDHIGSAYNEKDLSPDALINSLANSVEQIESMDQSSTSLSMKEITGLALDELESRFKSKSDLIGHSTGLIDLDQKTAGLVDGDLIIVAGRPSMGKTAAAISMMKSCLLNGGSVAMFSMEMPKTQLYNRMWAEDSGVPLQLIRQPKKLEEDQWTRLTLATNRLNERNLLIDDQAGLNVNQIRSRCRKIKRSSGLDMVVIDYLGLMQKSGVGNLTSQIGEITRALKNMAKDLDVPVILLSQLNRGLENRPNKRPVMSDLMDSSSIESDADVIMFIYRDEVYNPDDDNKGICEIIVAKQRNGELGTVRVMFRGELQRFDNFTAQYGSQQ